MKMKKICAIMLAAAMMFSLCSCGSTGQEESVESANTPTVTEAPTEAPTEVPEPTEKPQNPLLAMPADIDFSTITSQIPGQVTVEGTDFIVNGERLYMNGVNTPWDNWNDFGGSFSKSFWEEHFALLRENGINSTRIWISCNGDVGMSITKDGYVNGATTKHWENLDTLFKLAEENGIYIMATLMSFDHFKDSNGTYESWRKMVADEELTESYIQNYVIPFCERYDDFDSLWSIDLCNEPDWIHENQECGKLSWEVLSKFFAKEAAAIHENSDILVTVGFGIVKYNSEDYSGNKGSDEYLQSLYADENAYLDFYSTHFYEWEAQWYGFPFDKSPEAFKLDGTKPCVIGECPATGMVGTMKGSQPLTGDEMYINVYNNGWDGIMGWTSNGVDDCGTLDDFKNGAMEVYKMMNE
ncbi:MAG: cellulase family glycosylhydrolase [Lachnospiraceae bacterium]|nr:cellulase family glycosylhydrolase [Lachnospiraceae bacterium]